MLGLKWSPQTNNDMEAIWEWYTKEANEKVATRIIRHIARSVELLTTHPHLGHFEPLLEEFPQGFRSLSEAPYYKIVYWLEDNTVKVATVFDCRQFPQKVYQIISGRTDWVCEPQTEYKQTISQENA